MRQSKRPLVVRAVLFASLLAALNACSAPIRPDADVGQTYASQSSLGIAPAEPVLAAYPRLDDPFGGADEAPLSQPDAMSAQDADCRRELRRIGVRFEELAPIADGPACGIAHPVRVSALSGGVAMKPAATLSCQMALQFARWTKNELGPAARLRYLSGVKTIHQASSYSCRRIRTSSRGSMSAHASGDALDVARIELDNGRDIDIRKPGWFAFRQRGLLNNVRSDACEYFSTVLGPGYDRDHRDHFHFDLMHRKGGRKACH